MMNYWDELALPKIQDQMHSGIKQTLITYYWLRSNTNP